mmetsp:Transcript_19149/g.34614  ORF Transcript_19149/g.34614 Transcript_19149/m.34614 type:complete len:243 (+) Transcript_19149:224-952(+)
MFTNDQRHLLLVNLFEAKLFHNIFQLILGIHGFLRHGIVEATEPLAPRGEFFQPCKWCHHDNDSAFIDYLRHSIQARHGIRKTTEKICQNDPVECSKPILAICVLREGTGITLEEIDLFQYSGVNSRLVTNGHFLSYVAFDWNFERQLFSSLHPFCGRNKILTKIKSLDMIEGFCEFKGRPTHCTTHVQGPIVRPDRIERDHEIGNALRKAQPMNRRVRMLQNGIHVLLRPRQGEMKPQIHA